MHESGGGTIEVTVVGHEILAWCLFVNSCRAALCGGVRRRSSAGRNCLSKGTTGFESINVQIVPDHNLAVVGLTDLLQQLIFASCFSALRCPRLITARVRTVVENQQSRLCFVSDLGELSRRYGIR